MDWRPQQVKHCARPRRYSHFWPGFRFAPFSRQTSFNKGDANFASSRQSEAIGPQQYARPINLTVFRAAAAFFFFAALGLCLLGKHRGAAALFAVQLCCCCKQQRRSAKRADRPEPAKFAHRRRRRARPNSIRNRIRANRIESRRVESVGWRAIATAKLGPELKVAEST